MTDRNRLERSMLFVPAVSRAMMEKAAQSDADVVCLDLEDSVPEGRKEECRGEVVRALREIDFGRRSRMVRINGLSTRFAAGDIREVVGAVAEHIDLIMVPKVASPLDVAFVATMLAHCERRARRVSPIGIEAQIESAAGVVNIARIASASPRLEALILGAGDYSASVRMPASGIGTSDEHDALYPGHRYHGIVHAIVSTARANGLRCIDGPYSAHKDSSGFERACRVARVMGFDGKQCIHPTQLAIANRVFSESAEEVEYARRVVAAYESGAASGRGALTLDGRMIDEANVRMARMVLERAAQTENGRER